MSYLTTKDVAFLRDQARRVWESLGGRLPDGKRDIDEGERLALAYFEATIRLLHKDKELQCVLLESDSRPDAEDYE